MVVLTSRCPSNSWTARMSCPSSSRWVANEWRKVWQGARPANPAPRAGAPTARRGPGPGRGGPAPLAGHPVDVDPGGREDPLPAPLAARVRVLPHQGSRELDPAGSAPEIV